MHFQFQFLPRFDQIPFIGGSLDSVWSPGSPSIEREGRGASMTVEITWMNTDSVVRHSVRRSRIVLSSPLSSALFRQRVLFAAPFT